jgi:hypothetical protein
LALRAKPRLTQRMRISGPFLSPIIRQLIPCECVLYPLRITLPCEFVATPAINPCCARDIEERLVLVAFGPKGASGVRRLPRPQRSSGVACACVSRPRCVLGRACRSASSPGRGGVRPQCRAETTPPPRRRRKCCTFDGSLARHTVWLRRTATLGVPRRIVGRETPLFPSASPCTCGRAAHPHHLPIPG